MIPMENWHIHQIAQEIQFVDVLLFSCEHQPGTKCDRKGVSWQHDDPRQHQSVYIDCPVSRCTKSHFAVWIRISSIQIAIGFHRLSLECDYASLVKSTYKALSPDSHGVLVLLLLDRARVVNICKTSKFIQRMHSWRQGTNVCVRD